MATAGLARNDNSAGGPRLPTLLSWSGGKDCCMALFALRQGGEYEVRALLSTVSQEDHRIGFHGVHRNLIRRQATALGLPLTEVPISAAASNVAYEAALTAGMAQHLSAGVDTIAFGDLSLADIRAYREELMARLAFTPIFPVWGRAARLFLEDFIALGFRAIVASVDLTRLDASFAGRSIDRQFLADLPDYIDPCGENGEFHTFVIDGPNFASSVEVAVGGTRVRNGFCYAELV